MLFLDSEPHWPLFLIEIKGPIILGMCLEELEKSCMDDSTERSYLHRLANGTDASKKKGTKNENTKQSKGDIRKETGPFAQTLTYMLAFACPHACLIDAHTYVLLYVRRNVTDAGAQYDGMDPSFNIFYLLQNDSWMVGFYVATHDDHGSSSPSPLRCAAASIDPSRDIKALWAEKQRTRVFDFLPKDLQKDGGKARWGSIRLQSLVWKTVFCRHSFVRMSVSSSLSRLHF